MPLDACITYALGHSRELRQLDIAYESQRLNTTIQRAKFDPDLSAEASRNLADDTTTTGAKVQQEIPGGVSVSAAYSATAAADATDDSASLSVSLSKIILGGGSLAASRLQINNSLLDEIVARNKVNRYRRELSFRVRTSYHRVLRNLHTLKVQEMRLDRARRNLEHALLRENPLDIATARIEVPETEHSVLSARREIASSLDDLKKLIGMDVAAPFRIVETFEFLQQSVNVTNDVQYCIENHEDLLNARLERRKLANQAGVSGAEIWPKVSVSGKAEQTAEGGAALTGDPEYTVGMSLSWSLGARGERAAYRKARRDIESKDVVIAGAEQDKIRTLRELGRQLDEASKAVSLQEERLKLSQRRVELYADRWENGETDILEYIRSQNDLEDSRIELIRRKTSYMDLLAEYRFEVGR